MASTSANEGSIPSRIVICGGGVIGASIAYHLSIHPSYQAATTKITVVERCSVAFGASGKAGGFLASDWCDKTPEEELARKSFKRHCELAEKLNGKERYGFRYLTTYSLEADAEGMKSKGDSKKQNLPWLSDKVAHCKVIGTTSNTAQVHPFLFTQTLMQEAKQNGVSLLIGAAERLELEKDQVKGVVVDGKLLEADRVIIAMGPWSKQTEAWFGGKLKFPFSYLRAHSIVLNPPSPVPAEALFVAYSIGNKCTEPEVYPRPTGEVYVCGENDEVALPSHPQDVAYDPDSCKRLVQIASNLSPILATSELVKEQACYLPVSRVGVPLIGALPIFEGVYLASGHSCWGILNSPATGLAMAELLFENKAQSLDLEPFSPKKLLEVE